MANRTQTRGDCVYCGKEMTRSGLARHLRACAQRQQAIAAADKQRAGTRPSTICKCRTPGAAPTGCTWRCAATRPWRTWTSTCAQIWLECCGHLSAFEIGGVRYTQLFNDGMGFGTRSR